MKKFTLFTRLLPVLLLACALLAAPQAIRAQGPDPVVKLETSMGDILVRLDARKAPMTTANFLEYVKAGQYDGTIFHRVIPGFMIQGGDPEGTGMGGPGYGIKGEFAMNGFKNDLKHTTGVLSMARSQRPNSAGSQFFIMVNDAPHLDGQYAAFGKVTEGIDVAQAIVSSPRDWSDRPREDQVMTKVTVETFGVDYDEPVTGPERG